MRLSELKNLLPNLDTLTFLLPTGDTVRTHFHVTEIGAVHKHFIDCGGTVRQEYKINFQLWYAEDFEHRLGAEKLQKIIAISEKQLGLTDGEIEVEYQADTIGKYALTYRNGTFFLENKHTDCLAKDGCGIPAQKQKIRLSALLLHLNRRVHRARTAAEIFMFIYEYTSTNHSTIFLYIPVIRTKGSTSTLDNLHP